MKTFDLNNMDTYFKNSIPCREHSKEPVTNFCTERNCLKFLCPQCVELHSYQYANHPIESIKTCIKKTSNRITQTLTHLDTEVNSHTFLKSIDTLTYEQTLIKQLNQVKATIIGQINSYFEQKQMEIKKETSKGQIVKSKMELLRKQILQAINELKILNKSLFVADESVRAIKKANQIDYGAMIFHFTKEIKSLQEDFKFNIQLHMDPNKRDLFRNTLNSLIGIRNSNLNKNINNKQSRYRTPRPKSQYSQESIPIDHNYIINPPNLSADRITNQAALRIDAKNYFIGEPFLHFFQVSKSNLHILRVNQIVQSQTAKWQVISLSINFIIPSFHRTLATEDGVIYLIGGTQLQTMKKSNKIYQYDPLNKKLNQVGELENARSSQSILSLNKVIYIVGGMNENDQALRKCQMFDSVAKTTKPFASCKYPTTNSTLCCFKDTLIKMGGVFSSGENNDHIQVYSISANFWGQVDPVIQNCKGEFGLISCSGWSPLNDSQVFIYGGYNEESNNQNSKTSFVLEKLQDNQYVIKYVNAKNLPIGQGFWNQQGIIHNGQIYCLQNVDGEEGNDCLQDYRNLLIFNGKHWSVSYPQ